MGSRWTCLLRKGIHDTLIEVVQVIEKDEHDIQPAQGEEEGSGKALPSGSILRTGGCLRASLVQKAFSGGRRVKTAVTIKLSHEG